MRIQRTSGVSDAIVKPRRGMSLRVVKELPKPVAEVAKPAARTPPVDLSERMSAYARAAASVGVSANNVSDAMHTLSGLMNARLRTEEIPEDIRYHRIDCREVLHMQEEHGMRGMHLSGGNLVLMANRMLGPPREGYTRSVEMDVMHGEYLVTDHRPGRVVRLPEGVSLSDMIRIEVPYEMIEDDRSLWNVMDRSETRLLEQWRVIARYVGTDVPPCFNHVETRRQHNTRTMLAVFSIRF